MRVTWATMITRRRIYVSRGQVTDGAQPQVATPAALNPGEKVLELTTSTMRPAGRQRSRSRSENRTAQAQNWLALAEVDAERSPLVY